MDGYDILGELGRGGMGVVYKAREKALNRIVAIKMILSGAHAVDAERERFRREAEAVAALQHPGIVQIFHIAEHAGQPYLTLEFVEGGNLAQRIASGDLMPAKEAAATVEQIARAMQYAHDQGIIHRDLKPANILLAGVRGQGSGDRGQKTTDKTPSSGSSPDSLTTLFKISDFGLAKKVDDTIAAGGGTKTGAVMGTPSYIAPEQAAGKGGTVTPVADVYSLGAILYELLTGRPPFKADTPLETVLQVLNDDPVPPSRLRPKLPRDLETVCLKCLNKDPARRYQSAAELADDLGRFQRGEPIVARPLSPLARGLRWARRHPAVSVFAATAALAVVTVVTVLAISAVRLTEANAQKEKEADTAREQTRVAVRSQTEAESARKEAERANAELREQVERNRRTLFALQLAQVAGICEKDPTRAAALLDDPVSCPPDLRDFAWRYLRRLCLRDERNYLGHLRPIFALAVSPDGLLVATGDNLGQVRLWSPRTRAQFSILIGHAGAVNAAAFSPDGRTLATTGADGTIRLWRLPAVLLDLVAAASKFLPQTQAELTDLLPANVSLASYIHPALTVRAFGHAGRCLAFSPDGRRLAAGGSDKQVSPGQWDGVARMWDVTELFPNGPLGGVLGAAAVAAEGVAKNGPNAGPPKPVRAFDGHFKPVTAVAFSPDGHTLATGGEDAGVQLFPLAGPGRAEQLRQHGGPVYSLAFSPDGHTLATTDNTPDAPGVVLWDLTRRRPTERKKLLGHTGPIRDVAFSSDGRSLTTAGGHERDATVRVWDAETGAERTRLSGHRGAVTGVVWLPDRRTVVSASADHTARVWQTTVRTSDTADIDPDEPTKVIAAAVAENGRTLVTAEANGAVRVWGIDKLFSERGEKAERPVAFESAKPPDAREWQVNSFAVSDDGRRVAAGTANGLAVWDASGPVARLRWLTSGIGGAAFAVRFAADGNTLYAACADGLRVWDLTSGQETTPAVFRTEAKATTSRYALAVSADLTVTLTTRRDGKEYLTLIAGERAVHVELKDVLSVEFSPDGGELVTATLGGGTRVWAVDRSPLGLRPQADSREPVLSARFGKGGRTVIGVGINRDVLAFDPVTGQEQAVLSGHTDRIVGYGVIGSDWGLVSVGRDGTVKRWRAEPLQRVEIRQLPGFPNRPAGK